MQNQKDYEQKNYYNQDTNMVQYEQQDNTSIPQTQQQKLQQQQYQPLDSYIICKTLGKGNFGKVKLGIHKITNQKVAIKILQKDLIFQQTDILRISRELKIMKKLRHPFVVQLYEIIQTSKELYLIMEYAQGGDLFEKIVREERLKEKEAAIVFSQIALGLQYIHEKGVTHRDLKPENILLSKNGLIKIADFGLGNMFKGEEKLKTACGSPCYASPEMLNRQEYDPKKIDIWSSGIILYAMVCGYLPFQDQVTSKLYQKIRTANIKLPSSVTIPCRNLIRGLLTKDPKLRLDIEAILNHQLLLEHVNQLQQVISQNEYINQKKIQKVCEKYDIQQVDKMRSDLNKNKHNNLTTLYFLAIRQIETQENEDMEDQEQEFFDRQREEIKMKEIGEEERINGKGYQNNEFKLIQKENMKVQPEGETKMQIQQKRQVEITQVSQQLKQQNLQTLLDKFINKQSQLQTPQFANNLSQNLSQPPPFNNVQSQIHKQNFNSDQKARYEMDQSYEYVPEGLGIEVDGDNLIQEMNHKVEDQQERENRHQYQGYEIQQQDNKLIVEAQKMEQNQKLAQQQIDQKQFPLSQYQKIVEQSHDQNDQKLYQTPNGQQQQQPLLDEKPILIPIQQPLSQTTQLELKQPIILQQDKQLLQQKEQVLQQKLQQQKQQQEQQYKRLSDNELQIHQEMQEMEDIKGMEEENYQQDTINNKKIIIQKQMQSQQKETQYKDRIKQQVKQIRDQRQYQVRDMLQQQPQSDKKDGTGMIQQQQKGNVIQRTKSQQKVDIQQPYLQPQQQQVIQKQINYQNPLTQMPAEQITLIPFQSQIVEQKVIQPQQQRKLEKQEQIEIQDKQTKQIKQTGQNKGQLYEMQQEQQQNTIKKITELQDRSLEERIQEQDKQGNNNKDEIRIQKQDTPQQKNIMEVEMRDIELEEPYVDNIRPQQQQVFDQQYEEDLFKNTPLPIIDLGTNIKARKQQQIESQKQQIHEQEQQIQQAQRNYYPPSQSQFARNLNQQREPEQFQFQEQESYENRRNQIELEDYRGIVIEPLTFREQDNKQIEKTNLLDSKNGVYRHYNQLIKNSVQSQSSPQQKKQAKYSKNPKAHHQIAKQPRQTYHNQNLNKNKIAQTSAQNQNKKLVRQHHNTNLFNSSKSKGKSNEFTKIQKEKKSNGQKQKQESIKQSRTIKLNERSHSKDRPIIFRSNKNNLRLKGENQKEESKKNIAANKWTVKDDSNKKMQKTPYLKNKNQRKDSRIKTEYTQRIEQKKTYGQIAQVNEENQKKCYKIQKQKKIANSPSKINKQTKQNTKKIQQKQSSGSKNRENTYKYNPTATSQSFYKNKYKSFSQVNKTKLSTSFINKNKQIQAQNPLDFPISPVSKDKKRDSNELQNQQYNQTTEINLNLYEQKGHPFLETEEISFQNNLNFPTYQNNSNKKSVKQTDNQNSRDETNNNLSTKSPLKYKSKYMTNTGKIKYPYTIAKKNYFSTKPDKKEEQEIKKEGKVVSETYVQIKDIQDGIEENIKVNYTLGAGFNNYLQSTSINYSPKNTSFGKSFAYQSKLVSQSFSNIYPTKKTSNNSTLAYPSSSKVNISYSYQQKQKPSNAYKSASNRQIQYSQKFSPGIRKQDKKYKTTSLNMYQDSDENIRILRSQTNPNIQIKIIQQQPILLNPQYLLFVSPEQLIQILVINDKNREVQGKDDQDYASLKTVNNVQGYVKLYYYQNLNYSYVTNVSLILQDDLQSSISSLSSLAISRQRSQSQINYKHSITIKNQSGNPNAKSPKYPSKESPKLSSRQENNKKSGLNKSGISNKNKQKSLQTIDFRNVQQFVRFINTAILQQQQQ